MDIMYTVISGFLGIGLFFLIIHGAVRNLQYRFQALINLLFGLILALLFLGALWFDYQGDSFWNYWRYMVLIGIALFYAILLGLMGFRNIKGLFSRKTYGTGSFDYAEYLYILYRHNSDVYLVRNKNRVVGLTVKLSKKDFHDTVIENLTKKYLSNRYSVPNFSSDRIGKVTVVKKKQLYYCYTIELKNEMIIEGLERINAYQVLKENIDDFNKQILYRMILKEPFQIEL